VVVVVLAELVVGVDVVSLVDVEIDESKLSKPFGKAVGNADDSSVKVPGIKLRKLLNWSGIELVGAGSVP
jgi:hypothetical protein